MVSMGWMSKYRITITFVMLYTSLCALKYIWKQFWHCIVTHEHNQLPCTNTVHSRCRTATSVHISLIWYGKFIVNSVKNTNKIIILQNEFYYIFCIMTNTLMAHIFCMRDCEYICYEILDIHLIPYGKMTCFLQNESCTRQMDFSTCCPLQTWDSMWLTQLSISVYAILSIIKGLLLFVFS